MRTTVLRTMLVTVLAMLVAAPASAQVVNPASGVEYEVLSTDAKDPLFIQVAEDGRVFWVEREGRIQVLHPDGTQADVGFMPVSANACDEAYCPTEEFRLEEGGLYSILLAPDFTESGEAYLFYSVPNSMTPGPPGNVVRNSWADETVCLERTCDVAADFGVWRLSKFVIDADSKLVPESEQMILEVPAEWFYCCHYGGNLECLPDGTILLSTGDDMAATVAGYGGRDPNEPMGNGERTSQNPADRRGKLLRLMPDGSVPDGSAPGIAANPYLQTDGNGMALRDAAGNLLTQEVEHPYIEDTWGDPSDGITAFDPYVYTLGYKQPFRGAVLPGGRFILGEVGPDGYLPDPDRGPRGVEELNEVPAGGGVNHGWPRCSGDNVPYNDYDYETQTSNGLLDCSQMEPAVLWYPHDVSERWPLLGAGLVTSIPAAFYPADTGGPLRLPEAFNNNLIYMEFSRHSVIGMPVTEDGHLVTDQTQWNVIAPPNGVNLLGLLPSQAPLAPIDATVGPDGAVYFLEYGNGFYNGSNAKVSRLKCAGCTDAMTRPAGASAGLAPEVPRDPLPWAVATGSLLLLAAVPVLRRRRVA